jgi:hypothetical protein
MKIINEFASTAVSTLRTIGYRLPDPIYLYIQYMRKYGRPPRVLFPKTFNEKLLYRKLHDRDPALPHFVDKITVKKIVTEMLGSEWVTPTLWSGSSLPNIGIRNWPRPYVIKANHGAGFIYFVHTQADEDWSLITAETERWLSTRWGELSREWPYLQVTPQLLVEPFIGTDRNINDYKFFVFNGKVAYIQVDTDRFTGHKRTMFNRDWERQSFRYIYETDPRDIPPPLSLTDMIRGAERIANNFTFARVDLYDTGGRPRFGEVTFFPEGGYGKFFPESFDRKLGDLWEL